MSPGEINTLRGLNGYFQSKASFLRRPFLGKGQPKSHQVIPSPVALSVLTHFTSGFRERSKLAQSPSDHISTSVARDTLPFTSDFQEEAQTGDYSQIITTDSLRQLLRLKQTQDHCRKKAKDA